LLRQLIERRGIRDPAFTSLDQLTALATLEAELATPSIAPRLTTWYRRASLTAESGRLRITLDERLTFCRPQIVGVVGAEVAPSAADVVAPGPARILEIKYWGDRPAWLARALEGLEPAHDFSKFKMGMAAITRKLESLVRPIMDDAAAEAEADADDADGDAAAGTTGYFAPNPSTV